MPAVKPGNLKNCFCYLRKQQFKALFVYINMKKIIAPALSLIVLISCQNKKNGPDVSAIKSDVQVERFDKDFFAIDSNKVSALLPQLEQKYPSFLSIFVGNVLGLGPMQPNNPLVFEGTKRFLHLTQPIYDSVQLVFRNTVWLKKDFDKAFQYVKYYFPSYKTPEKIITLVGPVDALAQSGSDYTPDFIGQGFLGISLQFYLGKKFSAYNNEYFIGNVAPLYRSRRFEKEYIVPDAMKLIVDDLFPDNSNGKPLIDQMIEKGKQWWLLDKFLPQSPDSLKTGYTQKQLNWCRQNEGLIWNYIITNENLYTIEPTSVQVYIGESPFTQGMPEASPGNIGAWVGLQIVKKFAEKNPTLSPEMIMKVSAKQILEEAKYKPK
jgi:hypothetical protein